MDQAELENLSVYKKMHLIFLEVFERSTINLKTETTPVDIAEWDSLRNVTLMTAIEERFQVEFTIEELSSLENVGNLAEVLESKVKK
jgi:acyl carrier protein